MWIVIAILIILTIAAGCFLLGFRYRLIGLVAGTGAVVIGSVVAVNSNREWPDIVSLGFCATIYSFALGLIGLIAGYVHRSLVSKAARSEPVYREAGRIGIALFYAFATLVFLGALAINLPGIYGPLLVIAFAAAVIRYNLISRDVLTAYVFSTIGSSMRQNLPLATALAMEASGQHGRRQRIMSRIDRWLTEGLPLSQAIRRGFGQCPGYALGMVAAAERIGQASQAVAAVESYVERKVAESRRLKPMTLAYVLVVVVVMFLMLAALAIFILPKFKEIFSKEFGLDLPALTRWVLAVSDNEAARALAGVFVVSLLFLTPWVIYLRFRPRRPDRPYAISRLVDRFSWHLPLLRWFARNDSALQTVSFLRMALAAGRPMDEAIAGAAELDVNIVYRRRLIRWHEQVVRGDNVADSARRCGIGAAVAWAFDQQLGPSHTLDALESLEAFYRANYSYVTNLARYILFPLITLALGACVGLIAVAMFLPLKTMIDLMNQKVMP
jgi:type II secretory pathway component PulF